MIRIYLSWRYASIFQGISTTNLIQGRYGCYMKIWLHIMRDIYLYKLHLGKPKDLHKFIQYFNYFFKCKSRNYMWNFFWNISTENIKLQVRNSWSSIYLLWKTVASILDFLLKIIHAWSFLGSYGLARFSSTILKFKFQDAYMDIQFSLS